MSSSAQQATTVDALKQDRDRFVAFAFASSDMLIELNENHDIVYIDGATRGFLGDAADSFLNRNVTELFEEGQSKSWKRILYDITNTGRVQQRKLILASRIFPNLPVAISGVTLPSNETSIFLSFSILRHEIDESEISARDITTGLFNREEFSKRAAERMRELVDSGIDAQMSLIDLPDFKGFLDKLEPERAKELSLQIAEYLRSHSIAEDTAGLVDDGVFSFVHDETVVGDDVLSEVKSLLVKLAPTMQGMTAQLSTVEANIGNLNEEDASRAILYTLNHFAETKENFSFNSIQDSYDALLDETVQRISSFKSTVEDDAFQIAYQPIVDLRNGKIHHYEALVRFDTSSSAHSCNPFQFINFGEQTGLISEFDLAMCRRTLEVLDRAHDAGRWPLVAINLSGKSLSSQFFMDTMLILLDKFPHIRKQLIIEVTESAKITDMECANRFIQELRKRGHVCCLDDFGVAESSFDYLRHLHVDHIKIDGSYVQDNLDTTRGRHLLRAMVGMCRNLGMTTIAEMVEDKKTASVLWESGVHYGQGWLFGKPNTDESTLENWNQKTPDFEGMMTTKKDEPED
ncbi:MAG: EAL domain-containing protein [Rickettsiales bacterium]|nr:EAL domain-containing protein [Rickettsiales bacterium]